MDIYSREEIKVALEDDDIEAADEAFMQGFLF